MYIFIYLVEFGFWFNLVFSLLDLWSGNFLLIVPFPDQCLLLLSFNLKAFLSYTVCYSCMFQVNSCSD